MVVVFKFPFLLKLPSDINYLTALKASFMALTLSFSEGWYLLISFEYWGGRVFPPIGFTYWILISSSSLRSETDLDPFKEKLSCSLNSCIFLSQMDETQFCFFLNF